MSQGNKVCVVGYSAITLARRKVEWIRQSKSNKINSKKCNTHVQKLFSFLLFLLSWILRLVSLTLQVKKLFREKTFWFRIDFLRLLCWFEITDRDKVKESSFTFLSSIQRLLPNVLCPNVLLLSPWFRVWFYDQK